MNEKLVERVFNWVADASQQIGDFASREIPPFIHEYLTWKFFQASYTAAWGIFITLSCFIFLCAEGKKMWKWADENARESEGFSYVAVILGYVIISLVMFFAIPNTAIKEMVQIKVAPKVYLVEKAAEIVKKAGQ